jgi:hypothetical protein
MHKLEEKVKEKIDEVLEDGITPNNLEYMYKLVDIYKDAKEVECMNYGNYGNYGRDEYGTYDGYGARRRDSRGRYMARGYDTKYRGDDSLDRMAGEYGRYMESRERYGANDQETDKSFHYMVEALEDFIMVLKEEAETSQQKQQLMETLQRSMR